MKYYLKNRDKKNFVAKTVSADLDFSGGFDKKPKKIERSPIRKIKDIFGF